MNTSSLTVGLLYAGEMGASLAALLGERGFRIVTTIAGRTDRTVQRCQNKNLLLSDDLAAFVYNRIVALSRTS